MLVRPSRDVQVLELAATQHSVVTSAQLQLLGVDRSWVRRRVRTGAMTVAMDRTYVVDASVVRGIGFEPDFAWPDRRLVVELDGGEVAHGRPRDVVYDASRDDLARSAGWRVRRFSSSDVWRKLDDCIAAVRADW